jgi:hypothetical protein
MTMRAMPSAPHHPFAVALLLSLLVKFWLATRQMRHVAAHRGAVPAAFAATVTLAAHQKAADYTLAKGRLGLLSTAFGTAVLLGWTLLGGLDALNTWLLRHACSRPGGNMAYQLALLVGFTLISALLDLPFELYSTFRLEQRFGFNRTTPKLFVIDLLKGALVGALIGLPLAALVLWIMGAAGGLWWLWAWGAWVGFNLLIMVVYPTRDRAPVQQVRAAGRRKPEGPRAGADAALRLCRQGPVRDGRQPAVGPWQCLLHRPGRGQAGGVLRHPAGQAEPRRGGGGAGA